MSHSVKSDSSFLPIAETLVRRRKRVVLIAFSFFAVAVLIVSLIRPTYLSSVRFAPAGGFDTQMAALRGLASQFGIGGSANAPPPEVSPQMMQALATSTGILSEVVIDSIPSAASGTRVQVLDILKVPSRSGAADSLAWRTEEGVRLLRRRISARVDRQTGTVTLSVTSRDPLVSQLLAEGILQRVDQYVDQVTKGRVSAERISVDAVISAQASRVASAEADLARFLARNRRYQESPELALEHDRLQRAITLQQQVLVTLSQTREELRVREIQTAPRLTIIEPANRPVRPNPRRRIVILLVSLLLGLLVGSVVVLVEENFAQRLAAGEDAAVRLRDLLRSVFLRKGGAQS